VEHHTNLKTKVKLRQRQIETESENLVQLADSVAPPISSAPVRFGGAVWAALGGEK